MMKMWNRSSNWVMSLNSTERNTIKIISLYSRINFKVFLYTEFVVQSLIIFNNQDWQAPHGTPFGSKIRLAFNVKIASLGISLMWGGNPGNTLCRTDRTQDQKIKKLECYHYREKAFHKCWNCQIWDMSNSKLDLIDKWSSLIGLSCQCTPGWLTESTVRHTMPVTLP